MLSAWRFPWMQGWCDGVRFVRRVACSLLMGKRPDDVRLEHRNTPSIGNQGVPPLPVR